MAYHTGSAASMTAMRQVVIDACTAEGWAWNALSEELSNGSIVVRIQVLTEHLELLGRTSAGAGSAPSAVRFGRVSTHADFALVWPLEYHLFIFAQEVYLVGRWGVDRFAWCAWGKSAVSGLLGTGTWVAAIAGPTISASATPFGISATAGGSINNLCPAAFHQDNGSNPTGRNGWVHHGLDGNGWRWGSSDSSAPPGVWQLVPLLGVLPNTWNSEAVLLPLRAFVARPSNKVSMILDCEHARVTRIDNYQPGEVISIGPDRWMIFPWFRKSIENRAGGQGVAHSGTFGWALRYEGP